VGRVISVTDGDTIKVQIDGKEFAVRYIGVDSPEPSVFYGSQARLKNQDLVEGKTVLLIRDVSEVDVYDRLLRYVIIGDIFVNHEMVSSGNAWQTSYPPDTACDGAFALAQIDATNDQLGIWEPTTTSPPTSTPRATATY
jgi:micrococcal nuclease